MNRKVMVTPSEMRTMRENGMSNHDIAKSLDISYQTVLRYIGKQEGHMQSYDAFKDEVKKEKKEEMVQVATVMPKYNPKPIRETYQIGDIKIMLLNTEREMVVSREDEGATSIRYDSVPELMKFLEWVTRERLGGAADAEVQKP